MQRAFAFRSLAVLVVCALALAQETKPTAPLELIEVGQFHGDEMNAVAGAPYFGFYCHERDCQWREVRVDVKRVRDEIVDGEDGPETGVAIDVTGEAKPLFLLRNRPSSSAKPLTLLADEYQFAPGKTLQYTLGNTRYDFELTTSKLSDGSQQATFVLRSNGVQQELFSFTPDPDNAGVILYWVGDLDGDGKLDFYANLANHYNITDHHLFLSSRAKSGQLVGVFAHLLTTGC